MISRPGISSICLGIGIAAVLVCPQAARADQRYTVSGHDRYTIGGSQLTTDITYSGTQDLKVKRSGKSTEFTAQVEYFRIDESGRVPAHASFVQLLTAQGELVDRADLDPDYLTVLNQPFAIQLDAATLKDLRALSGRVPFDFPAPMAGGTLHGYLQRGWVEHVASQQALGVRFDALGPMVGPLPDRASMSISGTMHMRGTAYYALHGLPLLLALDETLTISGRLNQAGHVSPVTIEYSRSIRAAAKLQPVTPPS